jgi:hypothetical protein
MLLLRLFGVLSSRSFRFSGLLGGVIVLLVHAGPVLSQTTCEDVAPCLKELESGDSGTRSSAAYALGNLRDRQAVAPLMKVAQSDPDTEVRRTAIRSLGVIADPSAAPVLGQLLGDNPALQDAAVKALISIGGESANKALVGALENKNAQLPAIQGLAEVGNLSAKDPLIKIYRETDDQRVRANASLAVQRIRARLGPTEDEMGVPIYPGAKYFPNLLSEWVFTTDDPVEKVAAFYQERLNKVPMDFEAFKKMHERAFAGPEETEPGYPSDKPDRVIVVKEQTFEGKNYPSVLIFIKAEPKRTKIKIHSALGG